jgi:hypothetical protein
MSESKAPAKSKLTRAKAILREQWPEVIRYLGDRSSQFNRSRPSKIAANLSLSQTSDQSTAKA